MSGRFGSAGVTARTVTSGFRTPVEDGAPIYVPVAPDLSPGSGATESVFHRTADLGGVVKRGYPGCTPERVLMLS